jgi:hypothetical protein
MPFAVDARPQPPRLGGSAAASSSTTSVVRWSSVVPDARAADAALEARRRTNRRTATSVGDDALLPPTAVRGSSVAMEPCVAPSDRTVHMRTTLQRKPPSPASALIESAEFAIAAVVSGPLALGDPLDAPPARAAAPAAVTGSSSSSRINLSVGSSLPSHPPEPEPEPRAARLQQRRRSPAKKKAARIVAAHAAAPTLAVRMTNVYPSATAAATSWPHQSASSKALGVGPAPLATVPNYSALPGESTTPAAAGASAMEGRASPRPEGREGASKDITRSGAVTRDDDGALSPSARWITFARVPLLACCGCPLPLDIPHAHAQRGLSRAGCAVACVCFSALTSYPPYHECNCSLAEPDKQLDQPNLAPAPTSG